MANTTLKDESVLWTIYADVNAALGTELLTKRATRDRVIQRMADAYAIPPERINAHQEKALYPNVSKIMRLLFPKGRRAALNLQRELEGGGLGFNDALEIARGNADSREDCGSSSRPPVALAPTLDLSALFAAIVRAASDAGYPPAQIRAAFDKAMRNAATR